MICWPVFRLQYPYAGRLNARKIRSPYQQTESLTASYRTAFRRSVLGHSEAYEKSDYRKQSLPASSDIALPALELHPLAVLARNDTEPVMLDFMQPPLA